MGNAAIFFDRDGTLIEDPGYLNHPDQVKLLDGTAEVLKGLRALGYRIVVVTNHFLWFGQGGHQCGNLPLI